MLDNNRFIEYDRTLDMKSKLIELSWSEELSLELDRRTVESFGLRMPSLTSKYLLGVRKLSEVNAVSPYFFHLAAARHGRMVLFQQLAELGYSWTGYEWQEK
ncbi:hypothetical protein [Gloeocapsopsis sp. IPPAS B-1203]|uniref:hypothetical protein n=1 Tax=Gloeocapsopsis sp. IPPAS B-1203 TaxID=2049454 RepID=UPI000C19D1AD|nr:hypothetical protein [Gloeocapsopsis sp. IPPAS B-1203]PIG94579.1 hypothetical protein CSQ79_04695 [Gloeocapsopsis sp. IPPAS B-1203]